VGALVLVSGLCIWLFPTLDLEKLWGVNGIVTLATIVVVTIIWKSYRRVPRASKGRVGILLALSGKSEEQKEVMREFRRAVQNLVTGGQEARLQVVELRDHQVKGIDSGNELEECTKYLAASGCVFALYGHVSEQRHKGKPHHVLKLTGMVRHAPLQDWLSKEFSHEFTELLAPLRAISKEDDLFVFTATGQQVGMVAEYIIGVAAMLSGSLDFAETLFDRLHNQLAGVQHVDALMIRLRRRVQKRRSNVAFARSGLLFREFRDKRDTAILRRAKPLLDRSIALDPTNLAAYNQLAIFHFVVNRDIDVAFQCLYKCRKLEDPAWRFGLAFLYAYTGNLEKAEKAYVFAESQNTRIDVVIEVEEFVEWVLSEEPGAYQLYYCLGVLNDNFKEDYAQAIIDYERFTEQARPGEFVRHVSKARERVEACKAGGKKMHG